MVFLLADIATFLRKGHVKRVKVMLMIDMKAKNHHGLEM